MKRVCQFLLASLAIFFIANSVTYAIADAIIDSGDPETSFTGTWYISGASNPWDPADPGAVSLWSRDGDTYTWRFTPTESGYHDFSMWWTQWSSRSTSIPVDIEHWGGIDRVVINQRVNGGKWNFLNTYIFQAGVSYNITITSQPGPTSTCADAVQFVYRSGMNVAPLAVIDAITPNPAGDGDLITLVGHGEDLDGTIAEYNWTSDIDGFLGNSAALTTSGPLSPGRHTISFTVVDNAGASSTATQVLSVEGDVTEFIIDNGDPGTSSTGTWYVSGAPNPWDPSDAQAVSLWSRNGPTYTWTFSPSTTGTYDLSMWWTQWASRSTTIPVSIQHAGGTANIVINQRINGGRWNSLGTYAFSAGGSYRVTITSQPGPSSTCADAVKFTLAGQANTPPVASIDVITPPAATPNTEITFIGSGSDDGSISAYEWRSDIDGLLSSEDIFRTSTLSQGIHTIFFRVRDNQNAWSSPATALVVVRDCSAPVAIMPLGDSITRGFGEISVSELMTGYRASLHQQFVDGGYNVDFVGNRIDGILAVPPYDVNHQGIGGISAAMVASNVYNWLVENPADIVLLHIGTNAFTTSTADVAAILNEIDRYESDRSVDVAVILARIINRQPYHPETTVFNENLQTMAEARIAAGDKIVVVDQESALNYATDMWDELHPNNQGYAKMPAPWWDELIGLLPECATFKPFIFTAPVTSAAIGVEYEYQAVSIGRPAVTYSLLSSPTGMTIDSVTGLIAWLPAAGDAESHSVTVRATNSAGFHDQSFTIDIEAATVIIDNGDPETSFTGTWYASGATNPFDPSDPAATSVWSRDGDTYTWTFTPSASGTYEFSMWWTQWSSRSTSIPVSIAYAGGTDTVVINQRINGGKWNLLGSYSFNAGIPYNITITSQPGPTSTCADAVRFVKN